MVAIDSVFAAENDVDHAIGVEVGQDQWVDENILFYQKQHNNNASRSCDND